MILDRMELGRGAGNAKQSDARRARGGTTTMHNTRNRFVTSDNDQRPVGKAKHRDTLRYVARWSYYFLDGSSLISEC
jgi:hypothetical protein